MVYCGLFGMTEVSLNFKQTFLEAMAKRGVKLHVKKTPGKSGKKWAAEAERLRVRESRYPFFSNLTCEVLYGLL